MAVLNDAARAVIDGPNLAHLVTIEQDGSPQVSIVWVGMVPDEPDTFAFASLGPRRKLDNLRRDPRVSVSLTTGERNDMGLDLYLVVHGVAEISTGGAPAWLQRLAHTYLGPDVMFPPMDDPPEGFICRINARRVGGVGPWQD